MTGVHRVRTRRYTATSVMTDGSNRMFADVQKVYSPKMSSATAESILDRFRRVGGLLEGHFRLTSGLHSPGYLQSALVLQHPREAEACGHALAAQVRALGADVVLSPALGGIVIGQE